MRRRRRSRVVLAREKKSLKWTTAEFDHLKMCIVPVAFHCHFLTPNKIFLLRTFSTVYNCSTYNFPNYRSEIFSYMIHRKGPISIFIVVLCTTLFKTQYFCSKNWFLTLFMLFVFICYLVGFSNINITQAVYCCSHNNRTVPLEDLASCTANHSIYCTRSHRKKTPVI